VRKALLLTLQLSDFDLGESEQRDATPRRFPWRFALVALLLATMLLFPWGWRRWVEAHYRPVTYTVQEYQALVPHSTEVAPRIAIVFGARVYNNERLSAMLRDRVDTAIELYHAGAVDTLLLTGGQNGLEYDEPGAMMAYALARGVPAQALQPDYGGLRTYDSCYRAAHIFQIEQAVLVTQEFHLPRALLLCDNLGIDVVGVIADRRTYDPRSIAYSETRELPALLAALTDLVRRPRPPILGDPIPLD
jgi:SanA protein